MAKHHIVTRIQDLTLDQIIQHKQTALQEYRSLKKSSIALRNTHLEDLAEARAAVGNHSRAMELRQLQTHEHQCAMARRIRHIYGKTKGGGVTSIFAPDEAGAYVEMTSKTDVERAIMEENESKFRQASQTPFMQHLSYRTSDFSA